MKLKLGPRVRKMLGLIDDDIDPLVDLKRDQDVRRIRMRIYQALAATRLHDMEGTTKLVLRDVQAQTYRLGLKFTWDWPLPIALDFKVLDENEWEVEIVRDERGDL